MRRPARLGTDALASSSLAGAAGSRFLDCQQMRRTALATARTQAPLRSALCGGNAAGSRERDWLSCFVGRGYPRRQSRSRPHRAGGEELISLPLDLASASAEAPAEEPPSLPLGLHAPPLRSVAIPRQSMHAWSRAFARRRTKANKRTDHDEKQGNVKIPLRGRKSWLGLAGRRSRLHPPTWDSWAGAGGMSSGAMFCRAALAVAFGLPARAASVATSLGFGR